MPWFPYALETSTETWHFFLVLLVPWWSSPGQIFTDCASNTSSWSDIHVASGDWLSTVSYIATWLSAKFNCSCSMAIAKLGQRLPFAHRFARMLEELIIKDCDAVLEMPMQNTLAQMRDLELGTLFRWSLFRLTHVLREKYAFAV